MSAAMPPWDGWLRNAASIAAELEPFLSDPKQDPVDVLLTVADGVGHDAGMKFMRTRDVDHWWFEGRDFSDVSMGLISTESPRSAASFVLGPMLRTSIAARAAVDRAFAEAFVEEAKIMLAEPTNARITARALARVKRGAR